MAVQSALATVGVAKQTAKGSAAANATFAHGLTDGTVLSVEVDQSIEERTSAKRASSAVNRIAVMPATEFTCRAHPRTIGLYAFAALGGIATTGAGPYTHIVSLGDDLPYITMFGTMAGNFYKVADVKVDELTFSWDANEPVEVGVTGMGTVLSVLASTYTATTDESAATYFRPVGGTFTVDVDGAGSNPATAKINTGEVSITNNTEQIMVSGTITPDDVVIGRQEVEVSFDITPDNLNIWRTIVTGTPTGVSAGNNVLYGSFSCQFVDGTDTLTIAGARVAFTCDFPDVDPAGGTVILSLAGLAVSDGTTSPITITIVNSQATY